MPSGAMVNMGQKQTSFAAAPIQQNPRYGGPPAGGGHARNASKLYNNIPKPIPGVAVSQKNNPFAGNIPNEGLNQKYNVYKNSSKKPSNRQNQMMNRINNYLGNS